MDPQIFIEDDHLYKHFILTGFFESQGPHDAIVRPPSRTFTL